LNNRKAIFRFFDKYIGFPILLFISIFFKKKKRLPVENIKRIMVIIFAAIGDTILLIPTLKVLRRAYPGAEITLLCSHINENVAKNIPYIDNTIVSDIYSYATNPIGFIKFIKRLRKEKFEIIIDTEQWSRISALIISLSRYDYSVGFKTPGQLKHFIFDTVAIHSKDKHELETFLDLLGLLGIEVFEEDKKLEYFLNEGNHSRADKFLEENNLKDKIIIDFHPGCGSNGKPREWPEENYIKLGKKINQYFPQIKILITGSPDDFEKCERIQKGISADCLNIAGKYPLDDVLGIIEKVNLVICSNTGMLHLAACVGTNTLGLHGPTNPVKWAAYTKNTVTLQSDKYCSPCLYLGHDYGCETPNCMEYIRIDEVFLKSLKILNLHLVSKENPRNAVMIK
jgi:heptosyltransferase I